MVLGGDRDTMDESIVKDEKRLLPDSIEL